MISIFKTELTPPSSTRACTFLLLRDCFLDSSFNQFRRSTVYNANSALLIRNRTAPCVSVFVCVCILYRRPPFLHHPSFEIAPPCFNPLLLSYTHYTIHTHSFTHFTLVRSFVWYRSCTRAERLLFFFFLHSHLLLWMNFTWFLSINLMMSCVSFFTVCLLTRPSSLPIPPSFTSSFFFTTRSSSSSAVSTLFFSLFLFFHVRLLF